MAWGSWNRRWRRCCGSQDSPRRTGAWLRTARANELHQRRAPGGRIDSLVGEWRSSAAHLAGGQGVGGSNPPSPTKSRLCCGRTMTSKARRAGATERSFWLASTSEEERVCIRCHVQQHVTRFSLRGSRRELVCRKCRAQRQRAIEPRYRPSVGFWIATRCADGGLGCVPTSLPLSS